MRRALARRALGWWVAVASLLLGCGSTGGGSAVTPPANLPPFRGVETDAWLAQMTEPVGRDDVLPAFQESARSYGCVTDELGGDSRQNIHGEMRSYHGVSATCREGTIALITFVGGRVSIGCAKPSTRESCDALLRNIVEAR